MSARHASEVVKTACCQHWQTPRSFHPNRSSRSLTAGKHTSIMHGQRRFATKFAIYSFWVLDGERPASETERRNDDAFDSHFSIVEEQ